MTRTAQSTRFGELFKKYRLRSEIDTLAEFGDILAEQGFIYENSLFTRWQNGERVPRNRKVLLGIVDIFLKRKGIGNMEEGNILFAQAGQSHITEIEKLSLSRPVNEINFQIPFASLGELLKTYRLQKNTSQQELALSLGWPNSKSLEEIEQGTLDKPPREIIDKICATLDLHEREKNNLLLVGNYPPTAQNIEHIRSIMTPVLEKWPYSAALYDFCWRVIYINKRHTQILGMSEQDREQTHAHVPTVIEIIFDPEFVQNKYLKGEELKLWHQNLLRFLIHFKSLHRSILKDDWYLALIEKMMKNSLFRKFWQKARHAESDLLTTRYGKKVFYDRKNNKKLRYNIFVVPLFQDPRFEIDYTTPGDLTTMKYFQK